MSKKISAVIKEESQPYKLRVQPTLLTEQSETETIEEPTVPIQKVPITRIEIQDVNGSQLPKGLVDALTQNQELEKQVLQKLLRGLNY